MTVARVRPRRIATAVLLLVVVVAAAVIVIGKVTGPEPEGGVLLEITEEQAAATGPYNVVRVIDGDTLIVERHGTTRVRVIGIDTPETVDPDREPQCGGPAATAAARRALEGTSVRLTTDPTQGATDRYGRMLAYVTLHAGGDYGLIMLQGGHAREYTYKSRYLRQKAYKKAAAAAHKSDAGLWGNCHR